MQSLLTFFSKSCDNGLLFTSIFGFLFGICSFLVAFYRANFFRVLAGLLFSTFLLYVLLKPAVANGLSLKGINDKRFLSIFFVSGLLPLLLLCVYAYFKEYMPIVRSLRNRDIDYHIGSFWYMVSVGFPQFKEKSDKILINNSEQYIIISDFTNKVINLISDLSNDGNEILENNFTPKEDKIKYLQNYYGKISKGLIALFPKNAMVTFTIRKIGANTDAMIVEYTTNNFNSDCSSAEKIMIEHSMNNNFATVRYTTFFESDFHKPSPMQNNDHDGLVQCILREGNRPFLSMSLTIKGKLPKATLTKIEEMDLLNKISSIIREKHAIVQKTSKPTTVNFDGYQRYTNLGKTQ